MIFYLNKIEFPSPTDTLMYVPSLVEIGLVVLEKKNKKCEKF